MKIFYFGEDHLTPNLALQIANNKITCEIGKRAKVNIQESRKNTLDIAHSERTVYGINTGFGPLCDTRISKEQIKLLQENILKSHSVGVGPIVPDLIAKLMLITKVHALSMGYSGISLEVLERIVFFIHHEIIPEVPSQGSVGASGDLAPLAHLFLPIIGLGKVKINGEIMSAAKMHTLHDLAPLPLGAKEGLALINGTQFILSYAVLGLSRFYNCLEAADIVGAMSLEGLLGSISPFTKKLHELRPFEGSQLVAARMNTLLSGSEMVASHEDCDLVQDPYSFRCIPQVHGATKDTLGFVHQTFKTEINAVTDNPNIFIEEDLIISGGNFHGQPLALALDYMAIAMSELGSISERRTYQLISGLRDLPAFLVSNPGLNSGFMIPQYTAASIVSQNKQLATPASIDSIVSSNGQEDHVSMGANGATKCLRITDNIETILAIELMNASQGLAFRDKKSSPFVMSFIENYRQVVPFLEQDRIMADDIHASIAFLQSFSVDSELLF